MESLPAQQPVCTADFMVLCAGDKDKSLEAASLLGSVMEQTNRRALGGGAAHLDPARIGDEQLGCCWPPGTDLEAETAPDLKKIVPTPLHKVLLNPDEKSPEPFKACHCGSRRQDGGPCLWRALMRERNRAWVERVALDAGRIQKACGHAITQLSGR